MSSLPPFIMTDQIGSFARGTIEHRKQMIIDEVLSSSDYAPTIRQELLDFKKEIKSQAVKPLYETASDREIWDQALHPWLGKTWYEIPWFFAETYFYRRLLEIVRYFQPGPWQNLDPFYPMKVSDTSMHLPLFESFCQENNFSKCLSDFKTVTYQALWGNRADLSLKLTNPDIDKHQELFLLNHSDSAYEFLKKGGKKIAYLLDNATMEIFYDLTLIDFLLQTNIADQITCYAKGQPYFISDALPDDIFRTIKILASSDSDRVQALAYRLKKALGNGKFVCKAPPFLSTSGMFRELPDILKSELGSHDLCIMKGDANYRRVMGDRHWVPTTPLDAVVSYFPTSFLSLRTPKSEVMVGIPEPTYDELMLTAEADWQTNGKRGMITFWKK